MFTDSRLFGSLRVFSISFAVSRIILEIISWVWFKKLVEEIETLMGLTMEVFWTCLLATLISFVASVCLLVGAIRCKRTLLLTYLITDIILIILHIVVIMVSWIVNADIVATYINTDAEEPLIMVESGDAKELNMKKVRIAFISTIIWTFVWFGVLIFHKQAKQRCVSPIYVIS